MVLDTSAMEEPHLAIRHRPAGFFLRPRFLSSFLPVALIAVVGVAALLVSGNVLLPFERTVTVEGSMASKTDYFLDREVQQILLEHHIRVHITATGSRDIATHDFSSYDFVFPSGQPAGDLITNRLKAQGRTVTTYKPFTSPIVLASYREYAESLREAGVATAETAQTDADGTDFYYYRLDLPKFLQMIGDRKRWSDIGTIPSGNRITAWTPDICLSNSGATYMALTAFVQNGSEVPQNEREAVELAGKIKPLVGVFGLPSADPFNSYVTPEGKGSPIVVVYEHQFLSYQVRYRAQTGRLDRDRVLLYPSVNFRTEPQFIPLTALGERVGQLLTNDARLRRRAVELGFRIVNPDAAPANDEFSEFLHGQGVPLPTNTSGDGTMAQLPRLDLLEKMITITGDCPS